MDQILSWGMPEAIWGWRWGWCVILAMGHSRRRSGHGNPTLNVQWWGMGMGPAWIRRRGGKHRKEKVDISKTTYFKLSDHINWSHFASHLKIFHRDFPGGPVVKNPPCQCGGHGLDPYSWKIPHIMRQLSPCTTATELTCRWTRAPWQ